MTQKIDRESRKKAGEEVVSAIVRQALLAGATLEQLEQETGRNREEIARLLANFDQLEKLTKPSNR